MRQDEIRNLIRMVEESEVEEIEISQTFWGKKVRISKKASASPMLATGPQTVALPSGQPSDTPIEAAEVVAGQSESDEMDITDLVPVKSPMVGTFYAASGPDADPFVKLGDSVTHGQVVCIVEAMKLMNEIRAESDGKIVKVLVENGEPVEFGQTLFLLTPA